MPTPKIKVPRAMDHHVGARIRSRRMMLDMSQQNLGEALGVTSQQVQKYEKGVIRVSASALSQLSVVLQVKVGWFFEGEGAPRRQGDGSENVIDKFIATSEGVALVRVFTAIKNTATRRAIVALVERIADRSS